MIAVLQTQADPWLTSFFKYEVVRVTLPAGITIPELAAEVEELMANHSTPIFYYAKVSTQEVEKTQVLVQSGFQVIDVNITFERLSESRRPDGKPVSINVRKALETDYQAVLDIAETCFVYSRFHLDPHIPRTLANQIKREWVKNYLLGKRGEELLVAELNGQSIGFLAVLLTNHPHPKTRVLDLIGVAKPAQGQGVGKALVTAFIEQFAPASPCLRVGTQVANLPSIRLYESCGFRMVESAYVLHAHLGSRRK